MIRYTIYDSITLIAIEVTENQPEDGVAYTTAIVTGNYAKPTYDPATDSFYNAATDAEQMIYLAQQEASAVPDGQFQAVNNIFTAPQPNDVLNAVYGDRGPGFIVVCPNVKFNDTEGTATSYIKITAATWMGQQILIN